MVRHTFRIWQHCKPAIFLKWLLKVLASSWSLFIILSFYIKFIVSLSEILSWKSGLTVFQNFFLSNTELIDIYIKAVGILSLPLKIWCLIYAMAFFTKFDLLRVKLTSRGFSLTNPLQGLDCFIIFLFKISSYEFPFICSSVLLFCSRMAIQNLSE